MEKPEEVELQQEKISKMNSLNRPDVFYRLWKTAADTVILRQYPTIKGALLWFS